MNSNPQDLLSALQTIGIALAAIGTAITSVFSFLSARHAKDAAIKSAAAVEQSTDNSKEIAVVKRTTNGALSVIAQTAADSTKALAIADPSPANQKSAESAKAINDNLKAGHVESLKE